MSLSSCCEEHTGGIHPEPAAVSPRSHNTQRSMSSPPRPEPKMEYDQITGKWARAEKSRNRQNYFRSLEQTPPIVTSLPSKQQIGLDSETENLLNASLLKPMQMTGVFQVVTVANGKIKAPDPDENPGILSWLPKCQRLSGFQGIEQRLANLSPVVVVQWLPTERGEKSTVPVLEGDKEHEKDRPRTDLNNKLETGGNKLNTKTQVEIADLAQVLDPVERKFPDKKHLRTRMVVDYFPKSPLRMGFVESKGKLQESSSCHVESTISKHVPILDEESLSRRYRINLSLFARSALEMAGKLIEREFELDIDNIAIRDIHEIGATISEDKEQKPVGSQVEFHEQFHECANAVRKGPEETPTISSIQLPGCPRLENENVEDTCENLDWAYLLKLDKKSKSRNKTQSYLERFNRCERKTMKLSAKRSCENSLVDNDAHSLRKHAKVDYMGTRIDHFGAATTPEDCTYNRNGKKDEASCAVLMNTNPKLKDESVGNKELSVRTECQEIAAPAMDNPHEEASTPVVLGKQSGDHISKSPDLQLTPEPADSVTPEQQKVVVCFATEMKLRSRPPVNYFPKFINYSRMKKDKVLDNTVTTSIDDVKQAGEETCDVEDVDKPKTQCAVVENHDLLYPETTTDIRRSGSNRNCKFSSMFPDSEATYMDYSKGKHHIHVGSSSQSEFMFSNNPEVIVRKNSELGGKVLGTPVECMLQDSSVVNDVHLKQNACDEPVENAGSAATVIDDHDTYMEVSSEGYDNVLNNTYTIPGRPCPAEHETEDTHKAIKGHENVEVFDRTETEYTSGQNDNNIRNKVSNCASLTSSIMEPITKDCQIGDVAKDVCVGMKTSTEPFVCGAVVWGKFSKARWWPAIVIDAHMVRKQDKPGYLWLFWLSDKRISQLKTVRVERFSELYLCRAQAGKTKQRMKQGIQRALEICAVHAEFALDNTIPDIYEWSLTRAGYSILVEHVFDKHSSLNGQQLDTPEYHIPNSVVEDIKCLSENRRSYEHQSEIMVLTPVHSECMEKTRPPDNHPQEGSGQDCFSCRFQYQDSNVYEHPLFHGKICRRCREDLLTSLYAKDDDMCLRFCVICGQGGQLFICDKANCGRVYCEQCIQRHTSTDRMIQIRDMPVWVCFMCTPYSTNTHGYLLPRHDWPIQLVAFFQPHCITPCNDLAYLIAPQKRKLRVLSLFDGIGTGKVALDELGFDVEVYYASEVCKDAMLVTSYNHTVTQIGDALELTTAKLKQLCPIDLVLGGPPCNDLSIVNPLRKGFNGTGILVLNYIMKVKVVEMLCTQTNHVFWLLENTRSMLTEFRETICAMLGMRPAVWDAKHFTGQRRARNFWGNIPGMYSQFTNYLRSGDECRKKYQNFKLRTKEKSDKLMRPPTGGGPAPPPLTESEAHLAKLLGDRPVMRPIVGGVDTDREDAGYEESEKSPSTSQGDAGTVQLVVDNNFQGSAYLIEYSPASPTTTQATATGLTNNTAITTVPDASPTTNEVVTVPEATGNGKYNKIPKGTKRCSYAILQHKNLELDNERITVELGLMKAKQKKVERECVLIEKKIASQDLKQKILELEFERQRKSEFERSNTLFGFSSNEI